jgi:hypothetical protein
MSRTAVIVVAQLVAAIFVLGCIVLSFLSGIMKPSIARADDARALAFLAVIGLTSFVLATVRSISSRLAVAAVAATLVAGFAPGVIETWLRSELAAKADSQTRAERAAQDAKALGRIERRTRDVEARLAENRPYGGQDALEFVNEVSYVDLKYLGLPDRYEIMLALLKRALEAKLIDPNVPVKGPRPVDVNIEPLFLHFYRAEIRRYPNAPVRPRDWDMFKLLVASGADLTLAGGYPIAEDLQKSLKAGEFGRYNLE